VAPADRYQRAYGRHLCPTCERDYGLVSSSGGGRLFGVITVIWTRTPDAALPPPSAPRSSTYGTRSACDGIPPVLLTGEVVQVVGTSGRLLEHDLRERQHRSEGIHVLYGEEPVVDIPPTVQVGAALVQPGDRCIREVAGPAQPVPSATRPRWRRTALNQRSGTSPKTNEAPIYGILRLA